MNCATRGTLNKEQKAGNIMKIKQGKKRERQKMIDEFLKQ
jgi:hypothetical protein